MSENTSILHFPSGLSVDRAKKRAKAAVKAGDYQSLTQALNAISVDETGLPWGKIIPKLTAQTKSPIQRFMTPTDILAVMEDLPALTHYGFGAYRDRIKPFEEYLKAVEAEKISLSGAIDECNKACMYLQHLDKRKTINGNCSTYGLKHGVENYMEHLGIRDSYVANGAFICAAHFIGFRIEQGISGSANGYINYSSRSPMVKWRRLSGEVELNAKKRRELNRLEQELGLPQSVREKDHRYSS